MNEQGDLIFALDIGTRTVIGLIVEYKETSYEIIASHVVEHEERSMLDGQIHNVNQVAAKVSELKAKLEEQLQVKLERVAIAAAGRALKTVSYENIIELEEKKIISAEDVQALEFSAVQKAQTQLAAGSDQERGVGDY
ncbi:MAG TPA: cell division protein FtsA, partial [Halanaerobiales bacterium]|nr:cell division protein FtsA [Halanaerobiales bacterium]